MDDSEDNMSAEDITKIDSPTTLRVKPKKRSLVERELETNLTARVTSPASNGDGTSTSRYGRARRLKTEADYSDSRKIMHETFKTSVREKSPVKVQSPVYKMHASNSPIRMESPKTGSIEVYLDNQIESIYQENISLSRFGSEETCKPSPGKKFPKIYIRKDLIQNRDPEETVILIKNMFSPAKSLQKSSNSHLSNVLERSSEKFDLSSTVKYPNGHIDNLSVVKTLDFDSKKKKKENKERVSKNDLFELEAKCLYQVGDLAWARMGTYPFWPCIVTRDPSTGIFVKKKLFGRIEHDIIHVTFFGDNGRRGWIVDNMLKKFMGLAEFESARDRFTPEDKKRDPRLYAAFFISDKKQSLWNMSVQEAETLFKEPKRLRIDILNDMLEKSRSQKSTPKTLKSGKITRTNSDVSLSESLYDTLFSEEDVKTDDSDRSRNKMRNKSLDVSEVVTACLDNMAAKTGITKIQRQSHMDRWLQKAKSKTPEKTQVKPSTSTKDNKVVSKQEFSKKKKTMSSKDVSKPYSLRKPANESLNLLAHQNEHDYSKFVSNDLMKNCNSSTNDSDGRSAISFTITIDSKEKKKKRDDVNITYEGDDFLEAASENCSEMVIDNDRSTVSESDTDNISLNETNNVPCSDVQDMDVGTTSDTQDSCFSTEKSTETETSDTDSQSQTDSSVTNNNVVENIEMNDKKCFSVSSEDSVISIQTQNIHQPTFGAEHVDNNKDFNYTDDTNDTTCTDVSNKLDIEMINTTSDKGSGKKESIHSLSLQLGTEFNLGSAIHSNATEKISTELSPEGESGEIMMINNTNEVYRNETSIKESIDRDTKHFSLESSAEESGSKEMMMIIKTNEIICDDTSIKESIDKDTSTNDTFITVDELEGTIQNIVVSESVTKEEDTTTDWENTGVNYKKADYNKSFQEEDGSATDEENTLSIEGSQPDEENTVNTDSDNDTVTEIPNNNEDSVSDVINQNNHEVYERGEDVSADYSAISKNSEGCVDISNSLKETQHIDSEEVNLSNMKIKRRHNVIISDTGSTRKKHINNISLKFNEEIKKNGYYESYTDLTDEDFDAETASVSSEESHVSITRSRVRLQLKRNIEQKPNSLKDPEFIKYLEVRRDALTDVHPELDPDEIIAYLYKTWQYEESQNTDLKKSDSIDHSNFVKGLDEPVRKKGSYRRTKNIRESNKTKHTSKRKKYTEGIDSDNGENCYKITSKIQLELIESQVPIEQTKKEVLPIIMDTIVVKNSEVKIPQLGNIAEITDNDTTLKESDTVVNKENGPTPLENTDEISNDRILNQEVLCSSLEGAKDIKGIEEKCLETTLKEEFDVDTASIVSEASDVPLIYSKLRLRAKAESIKNKHQDEIEADNASICSEDSDMVLSKRKQKIKSDRKVEKGMGDPEFIKYLELRQDILIDENPQLTQEEITNYLFKTWLYEEDVKSELKKTDEIEQSGLVKGLKDEMIETAPPKRVKKKVKVPKEITDFFEVVPRDKPKRKTIKPFYNEDFSDIEDEIMCFEIVKKNEEIKSEIIDISKSDTQNPIAECSNIGTEHTIEEVQDLEDNFDEVELYFSELTTPKPNIFKGLFREKVCEICESTGQLVKCKGCNAMFHVDCVKKQTEVIDVPTPSRGRKKKKKAGRRPKGSEDADSHSDDKLQDLSEENIDEFEPEPRTVDAEILEVQLSAKMKEMLDNLEPPDCYSYYSSEEVDWSDTVPGKCEIVDVKLKLRTTEEQDFSDFKCNNCQKYDTPVCFVCKSAVSKKDSKMRQRCHVAHCHKYYHLDCLDHWPQTQFNAGEPSKSNKKINEHFEALTCPRHVCHTCVSDDPRGCKTRFSGDKLARCIRCPATYHSFTKCIPAGTQILTASHIICPRHYEHRPGKVPYHVNTGWCFICALGGSLICCEYCPTSFHAECLNIDPPEGGYMCEDCETGRLPLYGEMVWVKLGHYRWWPGIILHPSEIPLNILAVKHRLGEFVVRFFGQYDHYWVNRGRVFPFQEGDSGRISSQKSKIDAAFTTAMEHAQRACEILKSADPNEEESLDIASSLLPPHYVKLKVNKPCGSLCGRKLDDPELSLTQCECNPDEEDPCGLYSQCLNRMLLTECGPTCRAGDRCNNRAFEKRLYPKLVPYRTPHRGWGLKTLDDIKSGQFVIEYVGELIDEEEFKRRMRRKHEIRDENFYFLTLDKERMIDAGPKGNLARFMNHCCEPNCETQKWTVLGDVRVGLFAINDIPANTEVTFNYNLECTGIEKKRCLCGAKRCSGYIGAKPKQDEPQTKKGKMPGKRTYKKHKPETPPSATKNKPKRPLGRPPKPKELSEIEKDLLIIRNATNGLSSDESCRSMSSEGDRNPKALKRKRVSFSSEEVIVCNGSESPSLKKQKFNEKEVGD